MKKLSFWGKGMTLCLALNSPADAYVPDPFARVSGLRTTDAMQSAGALPYGMMQHRFPSAPSVAPVMPPETVVFSVAAPSTPDDAPRPAPEIRYDADWLADQPEARGDAEWTCLTTALYFEARGEPVRGQFAVAEVILNRVRTDGFPKTVCGVVNQGSGGQGCQFSFACDGRSDRIAEREAFAKAGKIARLMLAGAPRNLTAGATHFHAQHVRPKWARRFAHTATIGAHEFYRKPTQLALN